MKKISALVLLLALGVGLGGCAVTHGVAPSPFYAHQIQSRS
jgi:hypothetical protein